METTATRKPRYTKEQQLYSPYNERVRGRIVSISARPWLDRNRPHEKDTFAYKLEFRSGKRTKWIDEASLSESPLALPAVDETSFYQIIHSLHWTKQVTHPQLGIICYDLVIKDWQNTKLTILTVKKGLQSWNNQIFSSWIDTTIFKESPFRTKVKYDRSKIYRHIVKLLETKSLADLQLPEVKSTILKELVIL